MAGYRSPGIERALAARARADANPVVKEARRVVASGKRSFGTPPGVASAFEATSQNGLVPVVPDLGPLDGVAHLRGLQRIARHSVRNSTWFQGIVRVIKDTYAGAGPEPVSRHTALVDSFLSSCAHWDARGEQSFGAIVREDFVGNWFVDGEVLPRIELDLENFDGHNSPLAITAFTSDYCPIEKNSSGPDADGIRDIAGIGFKRVGKKTLPARYWMYRDHPRNLGRMGGTPGFEPVAIPAREMMHLFHPGMTGAVRGHVILAAGLLRSLKIAVLEDSDLRRRITAAMASVSIERPLDGMADEALFPSEEVIDELLSAIELVPGGIIELPAGYKANMLTPPDAPGHVEALRMGILGMCAGVGVPPYEVLGTTDVNERVMRFFAASMKTRAQIYRDAIAVRVLNVIWRWHVDVQMALGLWTPARPEDLRDAYQVSWAWPVVQQAALTQELGTMMKLADGGYIPPGYIPQTYLGLRPEVVTRMAAQERARQAENGLVVADTFWTPKTPTAQRIAEQVAREESHERDLVEEAYVDEATADLALDV